MPLPGNALSSEPELADLLAPDSAARPDAVTDFEMGGVAIGDASQGLQVRTWRAWVDGSNIYAAPSPEDTPVTTLLSAPGVTQLSLAFDQLMRPVLAFVQAGVVKLYWYDSLASAQVVTSFPGTQGPAVCLDDKRAEQVFAAASDVLFFYISAGQLCYRQQRERFGVERALGAVPPEADRVLVAGMGVNGRLQIQLGGAAEGALSGAALATGGDLFVVQDGDVLPVGKGGADQATWRSRVFGAHDVGSMGWARVEADGYPMTLRLIGDGAVVASVAVANEGAFRLPAVRCREWQVEVAGPHRVVGVYVAESRQELEALDGNGA